MSWSISGLATSGPVWVATGFGGEIFRAPGLGGPWTRQLSPVSDINDVAYGNGMFITSGMYSGSGSAASADGISWSLPLAEINSSTIAFGNGRFFSDFSYSTTNGASWTSFQTAASMGAAGPSVFVFPDYDSGITHTSDFKSWTHRSTGLADQITVVAFCGDLWVGATSRGKITAAPVSGAPSLASPPVNIAPAVELTWPSTHGRYYQVQSSADNAQWSNLGPPLIGNGSTLRHTATATEGRRFFRIQTQ